MVATVGAGYVGYVPDGIGSGGILERSARECVGETAGVGGAVALEAIGVLGGPVAVGKESGIELEVSVGFLLAVLGEEIGVVDGIEETGAVYADGALEA